MTPGVLISWHLLRTASDTRYSIAMTRTETPAPTASFDVPAARDLRWTNGVELTLPVANSAEYVAFLAGLEDYDFSR